MPSSKKLLQAAAGAAGGAGLNVEDVFSTYVFDGTGTTKTISNGIDLSAEGGLTWFKRRGGVADHQLFDSERTGRYRLETNTALAEADEGATVWNTRTDGFSIGGDGSSQIYNSSGDEYVSWTFRKAPKFFDVVTYSGSASSQSISHNLGSTPGLIITKKRDSSGNWAVYHRSLGATKYTLLNSQNAANTSSTFWNDTEPTSTHFTVGTNDATNNSVRDYVAYLFAHNDDDGEFGPDSDQDIIKCGSYTGNGSGDGPKVDLGFEPQWIWIKNITSDSRPWVLIDNIRGMSDATGSYGGDVIFETNSGNAEEGAGNYLTVLPDGFQPTSADNKTNGSSATHIYIAIRRAPMAEIESVDDVFDIDNKDGTGKYDAGWPVDFLIEKFNVDDVGNTAPWKVSTRKMAGWYVSFHNNSTASSEEQGYDYNKGWDTKDTINDPSDYAWMWRQAEGFFNSTIYIGDRFASGGHTVEHGLGVVPEMIICKGLEDNGNWGMYHSALGATKAIEINNGTAAQTSAGFWNDTAPTSTTFKLGTNSHTNGTGYKHVALLFASVAGICKVGSYTGTGSSQNIDCGFSNGAKLVMLKNADENEEFLFFDSERGIISGNSPYLQLGSDAYQFSSQNYLSPYSGGFNVSGSATNNNSSGDTFIYYAIAKP